MKNIYNFLNDTTFTIDNQGSLATPCVLTMSPLENIDSITITGLSKEPIILNQLKVGSVYRINGETGEITENGRNCIEKYVAWELPSLQPGMNTISITLLPRLEGTLDFAFRY